MDVHGGMVMRSGLSCVFVSCVVVLLSSDADALIHIAVTNDDSNSA